MNTSGTKELSFVFKGVGGEQPSKCLLFKVWSKYPLSSLQPVSGLTFQT